jgi:hypothetical protein
MDIKELAKSTSVTSDMQRYYLACLEEFGPDLVGFIEELVDLAYENGYDDCYNR